MADEMPHYSKGFHLLAVLLFSSGTALEQSLDTVIEKGKSVTLNCSQKQSQYTYMFWYKQERGKDMRLQLVIFSSEGTGGKDDVDKEFKNRFKTTGMENYELSLSLENAQVEDTGTYFCAKRESYSEAHFGKGTRLTVLEKGQNTSPPEVTIFAPSEEELTEKQKVTIVCLATKFFPDHVNLTWYLNDEVRTDGVKTETPEYNSTKKQYSLISRIRITSKEWQNSNNKFKCNVEFYNEAGKSDYSDEISGKECDDGSAEVKETYLRRANLGKLVYILLIFKSTLYGAFVMGLKLRKKVVP